MFIFVLYLVLFGENFMHLIFPHLHTLYSAHQSGFCVGYSNQDALLHNRLMVESYLGGKFTGAVFLDLPNAFDILLFMLSKLGFKDYTVM